jgi:hypothetical protein
MNNYFLPGLSNMAVEETKSPRMINHAEAIVFVRDVKRGDWLHHAAHAAHATHATHAAAATSTGHRVS